MGNRAMNNLVRNMSVLYKEEIERGLVLQCPICGKRFSGPASARKLEGHVNKCLDSGGAKKPKNMQNPQNNPNAGLARSGSAVFGPVQKNPQQPQLSPKLQRVRNNLNSLRVSWEQSYVNLQVSREDLFVDSLELMLGFNEQALRSEFHIQFKGEQAQDAGGLTKEWLNLMIKDLLSDGFRLFHLTETEEPRYTFIRNSFDPDLFTLTGKIIGKAILENIPLPCSFSMLVLKHILNHEITNDDIKYISTDLYNSMKYIEAHNIEGIFYETFSITEDNGKIYDFIQDGREIQITEETKEIYINLRAEYELKTSIEQSAECFNKGLYSVFPKNIITDLTPEELDFLICGASIIDVKEWRRFSLYKGEFSERHVVVRWFWDVLEDFSQKELRDLLTFVTGTSRVPPEGFGGLKTTRGDPAQFTLEPMQWFSGALPRAHTCFNRMDLPIYRNRFELRDALLQVIQNHILGFGLE
ncbi:hypothetical protein SteCoe_8368 [Stentor coeruleus]|uniref:HECT-type E3 ubiquitin transferase n=1 Tax=Stentor coeruleus TaxID=5963 RepID=A0A1R2CKB3_9CILI|nr:hypothetical protein SteCoe_8368 [Stentor coeruleus]